MSMHVKNHSDITHVLHYMRNGLQYQKIRMGLSIFLTIKRHIFEPLIVAKFCFVFEFESILNVKGLIVTRINLVIT